MIHKNWGTLVRKHFNFQQSSLPKIGDRVTGTVIANASFGNKLDINAGIPSLLQITELDSNRYVAKNYPQWMPKIGEEMSVRVIWFEKTPFLQILLSQKSLE